MSSLLNMLIGFLISTMNWLPLHHNILQLQEQNLIVEHVVLLKVKDGTDPSRTEALLNGLKALGSIEGVLYLSAGPVYASSPFNFTLMLHSRFKNKKSHAAYMGRPQHLQLLEELQKPICDDAMVMDWIAYLDDGEPVIPPYGDAMRVSFYKLKGLETEEVMQVFRGMKDHFGSSTHPLLTFGENYTPKDAKGFTIASLEIFRGINELDSNHDVEDIMEDIKDFLEDVAVVDYVI